MDRAGAARLLERSTDDRPVRAWLGGGSFSLKTLLAKGRHMNQFTTITRLGVVSAVFAIALVSGCPTVGVGGGGGGGGPEDQNEFSVDTGDASNIELVETEAGQSAGQGIEDQATAASPDTGQRPELSADCIPLPQQL